MKKLCCTGALALGLVLPALAQPVMDGSAADVLYGAALAVQDTQTGFGDSNIGRPDIANGSELDGAFGVVYAGKLYLVLAGNFETNGNKLELFFDTRPGGQNRLLATNPGTPNTKLLRMSDDGSGNGLTFPAGFEADFWVSANAYGDPTGLYVDYAELYANAGNPGVLYYCGAGLPVCGTAGGALSGGDAGAPAILATLNNRNVFGVTGGNGSDDGSGVKTGFEFAIPLAALGNPTGPIKVIAFINGQQHDFISNQILGGLGGLEPGNLGEPRNVDLGAVAFGLVQPFTVPLVSTPVGACCVGTSCSITTAAACGGVYLGDNTNCDGNPCDATPAGRCCIDDGYSGTCLILTAAECAAQGGTYGGDGTTCEGCPCLLPPKGACCVGGTCQILTEAACITAGGAYAGNYTNCTGGACDFGACCTEGVCSEVFRFQCAAGGGRFVGVGQPCTTGLCDVTISTPYVAGSFNGWSNNTDLMTETAPGSRIWTRTYTELTPDTRYEFKITDGTWNVTVPQGPNSWLVTDANGAITITYDANFYADGWLPSRDRLGLSEFEYAVGWTAVGNMLSELGGSDWNNADPVGAMTYQGDGIYLKQINLPAGTYDWKGVRTGSWDSISRDGRSVNTANWQFTVAAPTDTVKLWIDAQRGRGKVEVIAAPTGCAGDLNCDGFVNFDDIDRFVEALSYPGGAGWPNPNCPWTNGDCNGDNQVNFDDIDPFVARIGATCP